MNEDLSKIISDLADAFAELAATVKKINEQEFDKDD